ncbi:hypothetical protein ACFLXJ_07125 [Chloroflexota bacterium]
MNRAFRWLVIFIVTLVANVVLSIPVFGTTIFVREEVSYPLTIAVMALLVALTSSWISNLLSSEHTHSRLLHVVGITEIIALALVVWPGSLVFYIGLYITKIFLLLVWGFVLSIGACLAAWHFRNPDYSRRKDIIISLILLALAPTILVVTIAIASRFGLTGA